MWPKAARVELPLMEVDQVPEGWAVYLIGKRGKRRYYQTLDKAKARELLKWSVSLSDGTLMMALA